MLHLVAIYKGKIINNTHLWERADDALPKQLLTDGCPKFEGLYPQVNQLYMVYYKHIDQNKLVGVSHIMNHFTTCGYFKRTDKDWLVKKGTYKDLYVSEIAASFKNNPNLEMSFVKFLVGTYKKSYNMYTKSNVIAIINSINITYCEMFGFNKGSIMLSGTYTRTDITKVVKSRYQAVRNRLEWTKDHFINPRTKENCEYWIKYLDTKFAK